MGSEDSLKFSGINLPVHRVKSAKGSEDSLKFSGTNLPVHRVLNRSQLALFNFHFGLWPSVEKCSVQ